MKWAKTIYINIDTGEEIPREELEAFERVKYIKEERESGCIYTYAMMQKRKVIQLTLF